MDYVTHEIHGKGVWKDWAWLNQSPICLVYFQYMHRQFVIGLLKVSMKMPLYSRVAIAVGYESRAVGSSLAVQHKSFWGLMWQCGCGLYHSLLHTSAAANYDIATLSHLHFNNNHPTSLNIIPTSALKCIVCSVYTWWETNEVKYLWSLVHTDSFCDLKI